MYPSESIYLEPDVYHRFQAWKGTTKVDKVSFVNDDKSNNHFCGGVGRFSALEENELTLTCIGLLKKGFYRRIFVLR